MSDIIERLREETILEDYGDGHRLVRWAHPLAVEAADEIERLRKALKPFSDLCQQIENAFDIDEEVTVCFGEADLAYLRAAKAVLGETE